PSLTCVSGQTAVRRSPLDTSWPGRSARWRSTAKAFGVSGTDSSPRRRRASERSRRKSPKLKPGIAAARYHRCPAGARPGMTHSTTIALFKSDSRLAVVNRDADSVTILQVRNGKADAQSKIAEVAVGDEPRCVAIGAKEKEAFVVNAASGTISVVALKGPRAN